METYTLSYEQHDLISEAVAVARSMFRYADTLTRADIELVHNKLQDSMEILENLQPNYGQGQNPMVL
jgi:hypothetical protein